MVTIGIKKYGYFPSRTTHDMADGQEVDISLVEISHIDTAQDLTGIADESGSGTSLTAYTSTGTRQTAWESGYADRWILSGEFAKTAALIDHRMTTQDGLEFFLWFKEQTGIDTHLMGNPFVWSHDQLELNEDYLRFIRITGTPSTALTHLGILVIRQGRRDRIHGSQLGGQQRDV